MEHNDLMEILGSIRDELRSNGERLNNIERAVKNTQIGVGANHHAVDEKIEEQNQAIQRLGERHDKHNDRLGIIERVLKLKSG